MGSIEKYNQALSRDDISNWLVHLTKDTSELKAFGVLKKILSDGFVAPSTKKSITRFCVQGCTCLYDIAPSFWRGLIDTNPNARKPYGMIFAKYTMWWLGARPAIYTEKTNLDWPVDQRFRLIHTDLTRTPKPIDWMHEKEWRIPGRVYLDITRYGSSGGFTWWWPIVELRTEALELFAMFPFLYSIFIMEEGQVINRN